MALPVCYTSRYISLAVLPKNKQKNKQAKKQTNKRADEKKGTKKEREKEKQSHAVFTLKTSLLPLLPCFFSNHPTIICIMKGLSCRQTLFTHDSFNEDQNILVPKASSFKTSMARDQRRGKGEEFRITLHFPLDPVFTRSFSIALLKGVEWNLYEVFPRNMKTTPYIKLMS